MRGPDSFRAWAAALNTEVRYREVYLVASGERKRPEMPPPERGVVATAEDIKQLEMMQYQWDEKNSKAIGVIFKTVSKEIEQMYQGYTNAAELITALKEKYDTISDTQSLQGLRQAATTKFDDCKDMADFLGRLNIALEQFARSLSTDSKLDDSMKAQFVFMGLGEEWNTFLTSYLHSKYDRNKTTFEDLSDALLEEELRMKYNNEAANLVKAQKAKANEKKNKDSKSSKDSKKESQKGQNQGLRHPDRFCTECEKHGHTVDHCWVKHPEKRPKGWKKKKGEEKEESSKRLEDIVCTAQLADESTDFDFEKVHLLQRDNWIIDSGSTCHLTGEMSYFIPGTVKQSRRAIRTATGQITYSTLSGDVEMILKHLDCVRKLTLTDVLYLPEIKINLVETIKLNRKGLGVNLLPEEVVITRIEDGAIVGYKDIQNDTYIMRIAKNGALQTSEKLALSDCELLADSDEETAQNTTQDTPRNDHRNTMARRQRRTAYYHAISKARNMRKDRVNLRTWHRRFAHLSVANVRRLSRMVKGLDIEGLSIPKHACDPCLKAAATIRNGQEVMSPAKARGDRVFVDLGGGHFDLPPAFNNGAKYWLLFLDQYTGYSTVMFLKTKDQSRMAIQAYADGESHAKFPIIRLHSDNGKEFDNTDLRSWAKKRNIQWEFAAPYAHSQNGSVERLSRTILTKVRAVLIDSGLPRDLWAEVMKTVVFLRNISPVREKDLTPYEIRNSKKPNVKSLRVIGCECAVTIPPEIRSKEKITKIDPRAYTAKLVGYNSLGKQYVVWKASTNELKHVRDVRFNEGSDPEIYRSPDDDYGKWREPPLVQAPQRNPHEVASDSDSEDEFAQCVIVEPEINDFISCLIEGMPRSLQGVAAYILRMGHSFTSEYRGDHDDMIEPSSYQEAMASPHKDKWMEAMKSEVGDLVKRKSWLLTDLPDGRKALRGRWVYKLKIDVNNRISRFKARWVARGFTQRYGVDFWETYSPTARPATVRVFFAITAAFDYDCLQGDIKLAFLQGNFLDNEIIYVEQPKGFEDGSKRVCQLLLPLYGLKQSARAWFITFRTKMAEIGFYPSPADECLFTDGAGTFLILHVNDSLLSGPREAVEGVRAAISNAFDGAHFQEAAYYLGMKIERDRPNRKIKLTQSAYVQRVLDDFDRDSKKTSPIPMREGAHLSKSTSEEPNFTLMKRYQRLLGSLMYITLQTRPETSYSVGHLMRFASNPDDSHMRELTHLLRYFRPTIDKGIVFQALPEDENEEDEEIRNFKRLGTLKGYVDADFGGDLDTRRSTTGFIFTLGGGPISWVSKLQTTVSLSTCEAEYTAISIAGREALWLANLLESMGFGGVRPMAIYTDSEPAMKLAKNAQMHARSKHIDIRMHWIRDAIQNGDIELHYLSTEEMIADTLTKPLPKVKFDQHAKAMGVE